MTLTWPRHPRDVAEDPETMRALSAVIRANHPGRDGEFRQNLLALADVIRGFEARKTRTLISVLTEEYAPHTNCPFPDCPSNPEVEG